MGQQEVYSLLKRHRKNWLSSKDISKRLKASLGSVTTCLQKLRKGKVISFKMSKTRYSNSKRKVYVYRFKQWT